MDKITIKIKTYTKEKQIGDICYAFINYNPDEDRLEDLMKSKTFELIRDDENRFGLINVKAYNSSNNDASPIKSIWMVRDEDSSIALLDIELLAPGFTKLYNDFLEFINSADKLSYVSAYDESYEESTAKHIIDNNDSATKTNKNSATI